MIAQQVQEVFPEWVEELDTGYLSIAPTGLTATIVEALRELRADKDAEIDALRSENELLHDRLERLESIMMQLGLMTTSPGKP